MWQQIAQQQRLYWTRTRALIASVAIHGSAVLLLLLLWAAEPEREHPPIPVTLLEAEEPSTEPLGDVLQFHEATHPRVRESLEVPREVLALTPPPPDALLEDQAVGGGFNVELTDARAFSRFAVGGSGGGSTGSGFGAGNAAAAAGSFQEYVGGLRQAGLDVVFVIDATGSMGWLIDEVKERVRDLSDWIRRLVPVTRFGIVAYRDEDDPEFLTRVQPLTLNIGKVRRFLGRLEARGGGDIPEAIVAGLHKAIEDVGWRSDSKKIIVIVGDAPPHPGDLREILELTRAFRASGGRVATVDVSFDANPELAAERLGKRVADLETLQKRGVMPAFLEIAKAGGGDGSNLAGDRRVVRQLAMVVFGQRWSEDVRPLLGDL